MPDKPAPPASANGDRPPFTVVTVLHNSADDLVRLLDSIDRHLDPVPPIVIADSGSTDEGADLAERRGCEVVRLENVGFGAANNAGLERVATEYAVLLNPDIELLDAGLERLVERVRAHDILAVPRLLNADGSVQRSAHPVPGTARALLPAVIHPVALPRRLRLWADPWRADAPREVGWAIAACVAARTATLRRLGPFDPAQFMFFEDLDLCLRARAAGVPTVLDPAIALRHLGGTSTGRAYGGEPHELLARRRREVIAQLGRRAVTLDDAAQILTFATRAGARAVLRRDNARERDQLRAVLAARR